MKRIEPNTEGYIITTFDWLDYCEIGMFTFGTILSLHYRAGEKVFENNDIVTSVFKIKRQTTSLAERMERRRYKPCPIHNNVLLSQCGICKGDFKLTLTN